MAGQRTPSERASHLAELARLDNDGWSQRRMAEHLGVSKATIQRDLNFVRAGGLVALDEYRAPTSITVGRRVSTSSGWMTSLQTVKPPPDASHAWSLDKLDSDKLENITPGELAVLLLDLSPEVGKGAWDFLRMLNPGFEITAVVPNTDTPHAEGKAAIDEFTRVLEQRYGSMDIIFGRMNLAVYTRGAYFAELVLDKDGKVPIDFVTPDPHAVRFRKANDPDRGEYWELCQYQGGQLVSLERPTIKYVGYDSMPNEPYGRAPISASLFPALFLLSMFHDLRRVVQQQGYPRIDIEIMLDQILATIPPKDLRNEQVVQDTIQRYVTQVADEYAKMRPEDAYAHTSVVKINKPVGTVDSSSLGAVGDLLEALERMCVRGLKTQPMMMGMSDSAGESNANRQWEIAAQGIRALQHVLETMIGNLFTLALEVQGIAAQVKIRFAELRAAEELRDEQTTQLKALNAQLAKGEGWMDQDQAARYAFGLDGAAMDTEDAPGYEPPVDEKEGTVGPQAGVEDKSNEEPDSPSDATVRVGRSLIKALLELRQQRAKGEKVEVDDNAPLDPLPDDATPSEADILEAMSAFDVANEDYAGLLDAEIAEEDDAA